MKTLIIYDPEYSITGKIAQSIGTALGGSPDVEVCDLSDAKPEQLSGLQLLIIGSPVRGFQASPLIEEFVNDIPMDGLSGIKIAMFDRRLPTSNVPGFLRKSRNKITTMKGLGFAESNIFDWLTEKGGEVITPTSTDWFHVMGTDAQLEEGELERAAQWARELLQE